jgi:hypothetical protein
MKFLDSVAVPWGIALFLAYGADVAFGAGYEGLGVASMIMAFCCFMQPIASFICTSDC